MFVLPRNVKFLAYALVLAGAVGLACAHSLVEAGATVVLSGRDAVKLQAALAQVSGAAHAVCVDISDRAAVFAAADIVALATEDAKAYTEARDERDAGIFDKAFSLLNIHH